MLGCGFIVSGFWVLVRYWAMVGLGLQFDGFWGWWMGRFWDFRDFVMFLGWALLGTGLSGWVGGLTWATLGVVGLG